jgi:hypothetical protein
MSDSASRKVELVFCRWYMPESLRNIGLGIVEMRRPPGACSSTKSDRVGWAVISSIPVGTASILGLIGWVVYVVWRGSHPHWRCGGVRGAVLVLFF